MALVPYNIPEINTRIEEIITTQFRDQPVVHKYLRLWGGEIQELLTVFQSLAQDRDIDSATGNMLDIVGRIVGQERTILGADLYDFFGYKGHLQALGFGSKYVEGVGGRWWSLGKPMGGDVTMTDDQYRQVIKARIMRNNSRGTPEDMLEYIRFVFGVSGKFTWNEGGVARIGVGRKLTQFEKALVAAEFSFQKYPTYYSPKPLGVALELFEYDSLGTLGFIGTPLAKGMITLSNPDPDGGIFASVKYFEEIPSQPPTYSWDANTSTVLPSYMAFTRSSSATYFDNDGRMKLAANNVPRINYDPATSVLDGLCLEVQRINMQINSGALAAWTYAGVTASVSTLDAPLVGDKWNTLVQDSANSTHGGRSDIAGLTAGSIVTRSVYVKADDVKHILLQFTNTGGAVTSNHGVYFDLITGTMTATQGSPTAWSITRVSSDVWRVSLSVTTEAAGAIRTWIYMTKPDRAVTFTGDGVSKLHLWGSQFEVGGGVTTYIPTLAATATRASEVCRTNALTLPYDGFTFYVDYVKTLNVDTYPVMFSDNATSLGNYVGARSLLSSLYVNSTEGRRSASMNITDLNIPMRVAGCVSNSMPLNRMAINGELSQTTINTLPNVNLGARNIMKLAATTSAVNGSWFIRKFSIYTIPFSEEQLNYLTYVRT